MSYIEDTLTSGETVLYQAEVHWIIFFTGTLLTVIGCIALSSGFKILGALIIIAGALSLFNAFITYISTELAITNKRIIAKYGFIKRSTVEIKHDKIESISINQGIIERSLGAGTATVHGTGGNKTVIPAAISWVISFRYRATEVLERAI